MVILGLGSNKGDREAYLAQAKEALAAILGEMRVSKLYESVALLPESPPEGWDKPFLNMAVAGESELAPHALLDLVKDIEQSLGRTKVGHWGPREIDIDILAIDDMLLDTPLLSVPHIGLIERHFALLPFAELEPDWRWPRGGKYHMRKITDIIADKGFHVGELQETGIALYGND